MKVSSYPEQHYSEIVDEIFVNKLGSSKNNDIKYVPSMDDDTVSIDGTIYRLIRTERYGKDNIYHQVRKVLPLNR